MIDLDLHPPRTTMRQARAADPLDGVDLRPRPTLEPLATFTIEEVLIREQRAALIENMRTITRMAREQQRLEDRTTDLLICLTRVLVSADASLTNGSPDFAAESIIDALDMIGEYRRG